MPEQIKYYAMVIGDRPAHDPGGIARRRFIDGGFVDETYRRDYAWHTSSAILSWERGDLTSHLVEIDEEDVERIIARWHVKWAPEDEARRARIAARDESKDFYDYWVIVPPGGSLDMATGVARRRHLGEDGSIEQILRADSTWTETEMINEWERGTSRFQLIEIPPEQAPAAIARIRARMRPDRPGDGAP